MDSEVLFTERQKFRQWWLWLVLMGVNGFFPFHLRFKHHSWNNLTKSFVREYSAIGEYGGWGLRFGVLGKGKA